MSNKKNIIEESLNHMYERGIKHLLEQAKTLDSFDNLNIDSLEKQANELIKT